MADERPRIFRQAQWALRRPRTTALRWWKRIRLRYLRAWLGGYAIDRTSKIHRKALINTETRHDIGFGAGTKVAAYALVASHGGSIVVGDNCSINAFAVVNGHGGLVIGNDVRIASHAVVMPSNHGYDRRDVPIRMQAATKRGIVIEDDVWLGAHCVILDGVRVARGCIIAAGAVVTRSTEPYGIYGGVPARKLRNRPD